MSHNQKYTFQFQETVQKLVPSSWIVLRYNTKVMIPRFLIQVLSTLFTVFNGKDLMTKTHTIKFHTITCFFLKPSKVEYVIYISEVEKWTKKISRRPSALHSTLRSATAFCVWAEVSRAYQLTPTPPIDHDNWPTPLNDLDNWPTTMPIALIIRLLWQNTDSKYSIVINIVKRCLHISYLKIDRLLYFL